MKITNKHQLPDPIVRAVTNDGYSRGRAKLSVTQLISPPRIVQLRKRHDDDIVIDVADMIWALFGRAVHKILEDSGSEMHIPEERLFARVQGWDISGAVDLQVIKPGKEAAIVDYKSTSVWSVIYGKPEWESQLNCYRWLVETTKGLKVSGLRVVAFLRDWDRKDAARDSDYPQTAVCEVDIPMWSMDEATRYVNERVKLHQEAEIAAAFGEALPDCSDEERWTRKSDWAVVPVKGGNARRVFPDTPEGKIMAEEYLLNIKANSRNSYCVSRRIGPRNRCMGDYCHVSRWCDQWQAEQGSGDGEVLKTAHR